MSLSGPVAADLRREARAQPLLDPHADRHAVPGLAHEVGRLDFPQPQT